MRVDLSAHTWIKDGRLYTSSEEVSAAWDLNDIEVEAGVHECHECSVSLVTAAQVYAFDAREPSMSVQARTEGKYLHSSGVRARFDDGVYYFHRRAALVCDTAEQFRLFYDALKEARENETPNTERKGS